MFLKVNARLVVAGGWLRKGQLRPCRASTKQRSVGARHATNDAAALPIARMRIPSALETSPEP